MADTAESARRDADWSRARLAVRLTAPIDPPTRAAVRRITAATATAAIPATVWFAAPTRTLSPAVMLALFCTTLPGIAAVVWSANDLRAGSQRSARALHQAGAGHRAAWLLAAGRPTVFAGTGALCGGLCVAAAHGPLMRLLPHASPLRPLLAAQPITWLAACGAAALLAASSTLVAVSVGWRRPGNVPVSGPQAAQPPH